MEIFRIASAQANLKNCKVHKMFVMFETANQFFFKFYITLQCHET